MPLRILHIPDICTGCGACVSVCPVRALALSYNDEGFYYPELDEDKCIRCGMCEKICHSINVKVPQYPETDYCGSYMVKANDKELVRRSSSGGVFSLLADVVISQGGIVYGAHYNFGAERLEQCSTDVCTMRDLRKSKYIESYMGDTIADVYRQLKGGRKVLFCGTPCQVAGLRHFLQVQNIDMSSLLSVRFVCHGVPSNKFFTEYKNYEEQKHKSDMVSFDFRPKTNGWRSSDWKMAFADGREENGPYCHYYYYFSFQLSNALRSSCYSCRRVMDGNADITIGDFWGISRFRPDNRDQDGISLFLAHSEKALRYLDAIREKCQVERIPLSALDYIYRETKERSEMRDSRNKLMEKVVRRGYMTVVRQQLGSEIMFMKLKYKVRKILGGLLK